MSKQKLNILYLGCPGFPYGLAEIQRMLLISKSLVYENSKVTVICCKGIHNKKDYPELKNVGHFQGIPYIYSAGNPYRNPNFLYRNVDKFFEKIFEFLVIFKLNKKSNIDAAIISSMNLWHILYYRIISKILNFKIILNLVEYQSSMVTTANTFTKLNNYLFDRYAVKFSDGVLPISEYLASLIKGLNPQKKILKIPVIVDFEKYDKIEKTSSESYFLFCGAAEYSELILFIINSFELISKDDNASLYLVINGSSNHFSLIKKRIATSVKRDKIKLFTKVPDEQLSILYKNALALLIPMRPTLQDKARFPHKTGEYLASGNPVITTNFGEIAYYLRDKDNALVANQFEVKEFSEKLQYVLLHPAECFSIGIQGKYTALKFFDYKLYGRKLIEFISQLPD
jgi:glycosyltransferase involved in cell wall biosynthesis